MKEISDLNSFSYLLENRFDCITHHKVIVRKLSKHFAQFFLIGLKQSWIIVQFRNHFTEVIQRELFSFRLQFHFT